MRVVLTTQHPRASSGVPYAMRVQTRANNRAIRGGVSRVEELPYPQTYVVLDNYLYL